MIRKERLFDLWSRESYAGYTEAHEAFARTVENEATTELRAENDALRTLLQEAQKWLGDNDHEDSLVRRIDATLTKKNL